MSQLTRGKRKISTKLFVSPSNKYPRFSGSVGLVNFMMSLIGSYRSVVFGELVSVSGTSPLPCLGRVSSMYLSCFLGERLICPKIRMKE